MPKLMKKAVMAVFGGGHLAKKANRQNWPIPLKTQYAKQENIFFEVRSTPETT